MRLTTALILIVVLATSASAKPRHHHVTAPVSAASSQASAGYRGMGQAHAVVSKNVDGTLVLLNDRSVWSIDDGDAIMSSVWDSHAKIDVAAGKGQNFPFVLTNETTGDTVHAQFTGYRTQTASIAQ